MITIFLPGYSLKNKTEQDYVSSALEMAGYQVYKHQWQHWIDESIVWDPAKETQTILDYIQTSGETEISLIGKSIGTFISLEVLKNFPKEKSIKLMILMGIPANDLTPEETSTYNILNTTEFPLYIIQNKNDPHGNVDQVREILRNANFKELVMQGDTHEYRYVEGILEIFNENFK